MRISSPTLALLLARDPYCLVSGPRPLARRAHGAEAVPLPRTAGYGRSEGLVEITAAQEDFTRCLLKTIQLGNSYISSGH